VEGNEVLAVSNARRLFAEKNATYARFIAFVRYLQGLRAYFRRSSLLHSGVGVLDAGCGTGAATLAVHDALVRRAVTPGIFHAFDVTSAMLQDLGKTLETQKIAGIEARQANVLDLDTLPTTWTNYDLIVTASMLEYVPRERLSDALAAFRTRLGDSGRLVVFVTKQNWLTRLMIGALTGFVTQRYPRVVVPNDAAPVWLFVLLAATFSSAVARAQAPSPAPVDTLAPLARLVGRWTGTSDGQPGKGAVERQYERVLGSKFIQVRNRSTYPPQEKNPKGETHEDLGFFSFDRGRKRIVFRQFHIEGFVNQYVLEPSSTANRVVFTSESIENIPTGFRARETYVFSGSDRFEEIFEIAEPGKNFELYSRSRLTRAK
jgi:ubiquinone/menaquinone biosynthesis C-methylase UbiE